MIRALHHSTPSEVANDDRFLQVGYTWIKSRRAAGKQPSETRELWHGLWVEHASDEDEDQASIDYPLREMCILFFGRLQDILVDEEREAKADCTADLELDGWAQQLSDMLQDFRIAGAPSDEILRLEAAKDRIEDLRARKPTSARASDARAFLEELARWLGAVELRVQTVPYKRVVSEGTTVSVNVPPSTLVFERHSLPGLCTSALDSPPDSPLPSPVDYVLQSSLVVAASRSQDSLSSPNALSFPSHQTLSGKGLPFPFHEQEDLQTDSESASVVEPADGESILLDEPNPPLTCPSSPGLPLSPASLSSPVLSLPSNLQRPSDVSSSDLSHIVEALPSCCDAEVMERSFETLREPEEGWPKFISFTVNPLPRDKSSPCPLRITQKKKNATLVSFALEREHAQEGYSLVAQGCDSDDGDDVDEQQSAHASPSNNTDFPLERTRAIAGNKPDACAESFSSNGILRRARLLTSYKLSRVPLKPAHDVPTIYSGLRAASGPQERRTLAWALAQSEGRWPFPECREGSPFDPTRVKDLE
ncbi:hypothetical protein K488DRAFT_88483 [Vararia minispora EC-137]|uniref:Uncharacterized protein n=1 Tax=Vararia minispora EC-137 TaxID=1314806 RepID=A0ACB8QDI6_9AGAM|nr:hypothetical protein K488DRAFT_88483 [Vararia minispora EC-137]